MTNTNPADPAQTPPSDDEFDELPEGVYFVDENASPEPEIRILGRRIPITLKTLSEMWLVGMILVVLTVGCLCYFFVIRPGMN